MEEVHCLNCNREPPEDSFCSRNALILTDERGKVSEVLAAWCNEKCMGQWLVKNALDTMMKQYNDVSIAYIARHRGRPQRKGQSRFGSFTDLAISS